MFEIIIGLEVHVELKTKTKIFCKCSAQFGTPPNQNTCPICMGLSEAVPVLNKEAVRLAVWAGRALNCEIHKVSKFDRKHYVSPDIPKGYQITQYYMPLCEKGYLDTFIPSTKQKKRIGIARIHLEEDAGKTTYLEGESDTLIDFNRAGIPLIEIVTQPELSTSEEVVAFLKELKSILEYTEVSDCKMEQGSLRCDVNISVRKTGDKELGTKVEIKNLNSFKEIRKALEWEIKRQQDLIMLGKAEDIIQETRRWDDKKGTTVSMRIKGDDQDYQILPEPNLTALDLSSNWAINFLSESLPELPQQTRNRFLHQHGLSEYEVEVLTDSKCVADYFEDVLKHGIQPREAANWIMVELLRFWKDTDQASPVDSRRLADLINMVGQGVISRNVGKEVLNQLASTSKTPQAIVEQNNLTQLNDKAKILSLIQGVLEQHQDVVEDYKSGSTKAAGYLMGQIMKASGGNVNPNIAREILEKELNNN